MIAEFQFEDNYPVEMVSYPESNGRKLEVTGGTPGVFDTRTPVPAYYRGIYFDGV